MEIIALIITLAIRMGVVCVMFYLFATLLKKILFRNDAAQFYKVVMYAMIVSIIIDLIMPIETKAHFLGSIITDVIIFIYAYVCFQKEMKKIVRI